MAKTNTEKPSGKNEQKKQMPVATPKIKKFEQKTPVKKEKTTSNAEENDKKIEIKETKEVKKEAVQKKKKETPKIKKESAFVDSKSLPISTKHATAICKFIKNKPIQKAINELEEVMKLKKAVPMKGEIPHRKGKIMSGRFPVRASEHFITILKGLQGNANQNDLDEPIIKEAIANKAQRPFGRFGAHKKKRSHVKIIAFEKSVLKNKKKKKMASPDKPQNSKQGDKK